MTFAQYLAGAPADEFFWWSAIPAVLATAGFIAGFVYLQRQRLVEDMPTSRLRSVAQGYVELEGTGRLMDGIPIVCPLTATRCLWWRYKVEHKETDTDSDGNSRTTWVTVDRAVSDDSFVLEDGTGTCVIDPTDASVIPAQTRRWYGNGRRPDVGWQHGRGFWRAAFCHYRYTEEFLFEGQPVYALGTYRSQSGHSETFDEQRDLRELLAKWKHDRRMMALLDVNKDGTVDQREWEAARHMGRGKVREQHVARTVTSPDLHIVSKPKDGRPFILSGIPQQRLIGHYRRAAAASFAGMAVSGVFFLWALAVRGLIA